MSTPSGSSDISIADLAGGSWGKNSLKTSLTILKLDKSFKKKIFNRG